MNKFNKVVSAALTTTTAVWASGAMLFLPVASAQTTADLQAQIAALLAQITQLQAQLNASSPVTTTACSFSRDLTVGVEGSDVMCLQQFLNASGYQVSASGAGSPGNESSYFGSKSQAAVAKWQAAKSVSPAAGYFGSKSRAAYSSMAAVTPTPTPTPTPGTPAPAPSPVAPVSGLNVAVSSQNPAAGSLISSATTAAARVPMLAVDFTAGVSGGITLNGVKFTKTGVIADSAVGGAYLTYNGQVIAQYNSISAGVIDFSGLSFSVPAGQTRTLFFAIDPSTGLTAGNTTAFALASASHVTAVDANNAAITPSGAFPMNGSIFTITTVTNPAIANVTVASSAIATTVTAGTTNNIVGAWSFTANNSKVWLKGLNLKMIGSASKADLKNLKLYVNGTQVGSTLAQVASDGTAYFDLSAAPGTLNTGSNNIQVYADVTGSPSYNFQFEILNSYDVYAVDSQYNVPVSAGSNVGTQVTIQTGSVTVSQASDTPTGNLVSGLTDVTVAKFAIYAGGEAVRVRWMDVGLDLVSASGTIDQQFTNLKLTDDAGGQVGTTINTLSTTVTCTNNAAAAAGFLNSTTTYRSCFGQSASPINYTIPANTTRVLSLKVSIASTASFSSVTGRLMGDASNLQGVTSSQTASSGATTGAALTLSTAQLTVTQNTAIGNQVRSANSSNVRVGSYAFTASSADGVTISSVTVLTGATAFLQNMKVMVGSTQFGVTQGTVASAGTYSFSGSPFTVAKGTTVYVDVYADILSGAASVSPASSISGLSGSGILSYNAVSLASTVAGQGMTIAGQPTVTVAIDSATPAAGQLVMGSTGNTLASWRFTETSNVENVKITDLKVFDLVNATASKAGFGNVSLYQGSTLVGTAGSAVTMASTSNPGPGFIYSFSFATPVVIPQANSITLTLKGDVSSYASSGATDNTTHAFKIGTSTETTNDATQETVVALGNSSNASSAVTITANGVGTAAGGNQMTLLRTKLTVTGTGLGVASGRSKTSVDDLATINFAADAAGAVQLNTVVLTFNGSAPSSSFFNPAAGQVTLYDSANGTTYNPTGTANTTSTGTVTVAATGTVAGTYSVVVKGFTVTTPSEPTSTTATVIATDITTAINASSSVLGVTATSTTNVVTVTATISGAAGSITLSAGTIPTGASLTFATTAGTDGTGLSYNLLGYTVSAGTTKSFTARINSTVNMKAAESGVSPTLSITIGAAGNVRWTDALDTAASSNLSLPATAVPITITSVTYAAGT